MFEITGFVRPNQSLSIGLVQYNTRTLVLRHPEGDCVTDQRSYPTTSNYFILFLMECVPSPNRFVISLDAVIPLDDSFIMT